MKIVIGIIGCIIVFFVSIKRYFKPVEIGYKIKWRDWFFLNSFSIAMFLWLMILEMGWIIKIQSQNNSINWMLLKLFENGLVIAWVIIIIMFLYDWTAKMQGIYQLKVYNENVKKVFLTTAGIYGCIFIWIIIYPEWKVGNNELVDPYINRIIAWVITIVGIWINFRPEDKPFFERRGINIKNIGVFVKQYCAFFVTLLLSGGWIVIYIIEQEATEEVLNYIIIWMGTMSVVFFGLNIVHLPGKKRSNIMFKNNFKKICKENINFVKGHYGRVTYLLLKDKKELNCIIVAETVAWNDYNENEDIRETIFGQDKFTYSLEENMNSICEELESKLVDISDKRKEILNDAHIKAKEKWEEKNKR